MLKHTGITRIGRPFLRGQVSAEAASWLPHVTGADMTLIEEIEKRQRHQLANASVSQQAAFVESPKYLILPLAIVHFIFAYLVRYQYGQEYSVALAAKDSWLTIPVFWVLLSLPRKYFFYSIPRLFMWIASVTIGIYLVYIANEEGYYATMQRAPPLATVFTWLFTELSWETDLGCLVCVGLYTWAKGYSL